MTPERERKLLERWFATVHFDEEPAWDSPEGIDTEDEDD